ncbi:glycerate kinase [Chitinophaga sp. Cy-1792]|uniref:glycerate kinase type-2 family protein n=1 Tax=Chitinophaga sp. Cy-1792 TaxID=2608339 RepID=UPI001420DAC2|nr:DUF4147 domain-containing protein [Chitinophaga sp. Cy-1792]NIG56899.1 DUF4147 domain-containing protein [Chitinophaga sp. Cy-1792]
MNPRQDIAAIFLEGVAAVHPQQLISSRVSAGPNEIIIDNDHYPIRDNGRVVVVGAGKAAAAMATELEKILLPFLPLTGVVVTKYEHALPLQQLEIMEAGHPVPDDNSVLATAKVLTATSGLQDNDLVILLLSGGASALLADVPEGCTLAEVQQLFTLLLHSGADIQEMNTIRKHLSGVKGGQLAKKIYPATLCTIMISDVPGDKPEVIGSGPGVPDPGTFQESLAIISRYHLTKKIPASILLHLEKGNTGAIPETPKPGDPAFKNVHNYLAGTNHAALKAAAAKAEQLGYQVLLQEDFVGGDARTAARALVDQALAVTATSPVCILQGGETTVSVTGNGKGGRNQELALAGLIALSAHPREAAGITLLSAGTDGTDGPTNAAGAIVDAYTIAAARTLKLSPVAYLENNDAWNFFRQTDDLLITGPTQTNVMDIQIVLIMPVSSSLPSY